MTVSLIPSTKLGRKRLLWTVSISLTGSSLGIHCSLEASLVRTKFQTGRVIARTSLEFAVTDRSLYKMGCYKLVIMVEIFLSGMDDVIGASKQYDLSGSMRRYSNCSGQLSALKDAKLNETDYLVYQMKLFIDQTQLDNEQWANLTAYLDTICQPAALGGYRISVHIDVNKFSGPKGKSNRWQAIDDALDSLYYVFRRPSIKQQPLDFSEPQFYANYLIKQASKQML